MCVMHACRQAVLKLFSCITIVTTITTPHHLYTHRSTTPQVRKLVCNFDAPDDDVFTLYDNWEKAVARFPHVRRGEAAAGSWLITSTHRHHQRQSFAAGIPRQ